MTKGELVALLAVYPDDYEVRLVTCCDSNYLHSVESDEYGQSSIDLIGMQS